MFEFVIMVNMIVYHEPIFKVGEVTRIEGSSFTNRDGCEDELMQMYLREQENGRRKRQSGNKSLNHP